MTSQFSRKAFKNIIPSVRSLPSPLDEWLALVPSWGSWAGPLAAWGICGKVPPHSLCSPPTAPVPTVLSETQRVSDKSEQWGVFVVWFHHTPYTLHHLPQCPQCCLKHREWQVRTVRGICGRVPPHSMYSPPTAPVPTVLSETQRVSDKSEQRGIFVAGFHHTAYTLHQLPQCPQCCLKHREWQVRTVRGICGRVPPHSMYSPPTAPVPTVLSETETERGTQVSTVWGLSSHTQTACTHTHTHKHSTQTHTSTVHPHTTAHTLSRAHSHTEHIYTQKHSTHPLPTSTPTGWAWVVLPPPTPIPTHTETALTSRFCMEEESCSMSMMRGSNSGVYSRMAMPLTCASSPRQTSTLMVTPGLGSSSFSLGTSTYEPQYTPEYLRCYWCTSYCCDSVTHTAADRYAAIPTVLHCCRYTWLYSCWQSYTAADTNDCTPASRVTLLLIQMLVPL